MNRYLLSFDDTDELNMPGTGHLLDSFCRRCPLSAASSPVTSCLSMRMYRIRPITVPCVRK